MGTPASRPIVTNVKDTLKRRRELNDPMLAVDENQLVFIKTLLYATLALLTEETPHNIDILTPLFRCDIEVSDNEDALSLVGANSRRSGLAGWWFPMFERDVIRVELGPIRAPDTNTGIGRQFVIAMLQALTSNSSERMATFSTCHYPIFFTIDSIHGWRIVPNLPTHTIPLDIPPALIFPRHWIQLGDLDSVKKDRENTVAIYQYAQLVWETPLIMSRARNAQMIKHTPWMLFDMTPHQRQALTTDIDDLCTLANEFLQWKLEDCLGAREYHVNLDTDPDARIQFETNRLSAILLDPDLVTTISRTCRFLGNNDTFLMGQESRASTFFFDPANREEIRQFLISDIESVPAAGGIQRLIDALVIPLDDIRTISISSIDALLLKSGKDKQIIFKCFLAYLVDHCRAFYRPIIIADSVMQHLLDTQTIHSAKYPLGKNNNNMYFSPLILFFR